MACRRDDRDARGLLVCVRGTVGCGLEHPVPGAVVASGIAACVSTSGRPSDDFAGCVE